MAEDPRGSSGTVADRAPQTGRNFVSRTAVYFGAGTFIATFHYLVKCYSGGHFHFTPPPDELLDMWYPAVLAIFDTLATIGMIFRNRLNKLAEG